MTWDITTPDGGEALSNGDNRIRELKTDLQTALRGNAADGTEAKFPGADTASPVFRYRGLKGATSARPVSGQYGLYVDTTRNAIQRDNGSSWEDVATLIPAATVMIFYQASAPTGWSKLTTQDDKALRVVSGATGGTAGGTQALSTAITLAHSHTVNSHTHTISSDGGHTHTVASHTHTLANHTHSTPTHQHILDYDTELRALLPSSTGQEVRSDDTDGSYIYEDVTVSAGSNWVQRKIKNYTKTDGNGTTGTPSDNTSGAATPSTDSQGAHTHAGATGGTAPSTDSVLSNVSLAYIDVIICSKD